MEPAGLSNSNKSSIGDEPHPNQLNISRNLTPQPPIN